METALFTTQRGVDLSLTRMGCGGTPFGNLYTSLTHAEVDALVDAAWESGIRYFDTAPQYGHGLSEQRLGPSLRRYPRSEYRLSTKVGKLIEPAESGDAADRNYHPGPPPRHIRFDYSYDGVMRSFEQSLGRLDHDRVDILFVHDIDIFTHGSDEAALERFRQLIDLGGWRALDELRSSGAVAAIGAGVNEWEPCVRLLEVADPDLFLLAGRYTLLEQGALATMFPLCADRGVPVVLGGPYNSGVLARRGGAFNYGPAPSAVIERAERLRIVCERHGVHLADAAIRFLTACPQIVSILPGHATPAELRANVAALDAPVPAALWTDLKEAGLLPREAPVPQGEELCLSA